MFCYPENIEVELKKLCSRLQKRPFIGESDRAAFVQAAAEFLADMNAIHCFREGNGRAQLSFMFLIAQRAGHPVDLARIKPEAFLKAMIASFSGDTAPLGKQLAALC